MFSLSKTPFSNLNDNEIYTAYEKAALNSMKKAAEEAQDKTLNVPTKQRVTIDGSWQKRGFTSLNGVVTAVVNNKIIDTKAFSKHCKGFSMWKKHRGSPAYNRWKADQICRINHTKSSGAMEAAGALEIFSLSVEKYNLVYHEYLGDGDTSSFKEVEESNPYKSYNTQPIKLECIGHVQKRLGTRLRKIVQKYKGTDKPLHGKGNLTNSAIDSMQSYYGIAIRNNTNNIYAMKKAIGAVLWHSTNFSDNSIRHSMCPRDEYSWCKWQLDKLKATNTHTNKINLPIFIHNITKPIFKDLPDGDLLRKCLHGQTQNSNEAFHSILWTRCPKNIFVSRRTFELCINSAIVHYDVMVEMG